MSSSDSATENVLFTEKRTDCVCNLWGEYVSLQNRWTWVWKQMHKEANIYISLQLAIHFEQCNDWLEGGASEIAKGCFVNVAAKLVKTANEIHIYLRVKINHRRQIWDILVRFRATPKLPSVILARGSKWLAANFIHFGAISCDSKTALGCQAALRARTPKYWIDQIIILDPLLVRI